MAIVVSSIRNGRWIIKFLAALKKNNEAFESARLLEAANLPLVLINGVPVKVADALKRVALDDKAVPQPGAVTTLLYGYANPASVRHQRKLRGLARELAKLVSKTENLMERTADRISGVAANFELGSMTWDVGLEAPTVNALRYASKLAAKLRTRYERIPSQSGEARSEEELVYLCLFIEANTGRPHQGDIAYLIEAALQTHGIREDWNDDKVRQVVNRFKKNQIRTCGVSFSVTSLTVRLSPHPGDPRRIAKVADNRTPKPPEIHPFASTLTFTVPY